MLLEKDPYYEVGTEDDIVVSNSALKEIDPKRNGSPRKFRQFFTERKDVTTKPMLRGQVFHLYCEDKEAFKVSEAIKPSDKLGEVADAVVIKYNSLEDEQSKSEMMMMIDQHILQACRAIGWNKSYGDTAIIKNAQSVGTYLVALNDPANKGKIILTAPLKEQIEKCVESLSANTYAHRLLFWKDEFSDIQYFKEKDIYWTEVIDGVTIKCKAKLDDLIIDHEKKVIKINDAKTTGGSAHNFEGTFKAYRLDIQFAMYTRAVIALMREEGKYRVEEYGFQYRNIVVETAGLFETVVHRWSQDIISAAQFDLDNLLRRVIKARENKFTMSIEEEKGKGEVLHKELEDK